MFKKLVGMLLGTGETVREGVQIEKPISVESYKKTDTGLEYSDLKIGDGSAAKASGMQAQQE